jgi:hypothetical protein
MVGLNAADKLIAARGVATSDELAKQNPTTP